MSQSPEGSAGDFHAVESSLVEIEEKVSIPRRVRRRFPPHFHRRPLTFRVRKVSQSPEGSAGDFHENRYGHLEHRDRCCLNPPKGPPAISTPFLRNRSRTSSGECLNPPKGPPAISTMSRQCEGTSLRWSQSPEGSAGDFHFVNTIIHDLDLLVSQSPEGSAGDFHSTVSPSNQRVMAKSQSPEGSAGDFHDGRADFALTVGLACLNPPKGPPAISTTCPW